MLHKRFLIQQKVSFAILLFLLFFGMIHLAKPDLLYFKEGGFRPFGIGYSHKTILPIWIVSIILALFSYILVSWYISVYYDL
jgi:hypothetical protein